MHGEYDDMLASLTIRQKSAFQVGDRITLKTYSIGAPGIVKMVDDTDGTVWISFPEDGMTFSVWISNQPGNDADYA